MAHRSVNYGFSQNGTSSYTHPILFGNQNGGQNNETLGKVTRMLAALDKTIAKMSHLTFRVCLLQSLFIHLDPMIQSIQSVGFISTRPFRCRTCRTSVTRKIREQSYIDYIPTMQQQAVVQKQNYSFKPDIFRIFHIQDKRTSDRKR